MGAAANSSSSSSSSSSSTAASAAARHKITNKKVDKQKVSDNCVAENAAAATPAAAATSSSSSSSISSNMPTLKKEKKPPSWPSSEFHKPSFRPSSGKTHVQQHCQYLQENHIRSFLLCFFLQWQGCLQKMRRESEKKWPQESIQWPSGCRRASGEHQKIQWHQESQCLQEDAVASGEAVVVMPQHPSHQETKQTKPPRVPSHQETKQRLAKKAPRRQRRPSKGSPKRNKMRLQSSSSFHLKPLMKDCKWQWRCRLISR